MILNKEIKIIEGLKKLAKKEMLMYIDNDGVEHYEDYKTYISCLNSSTSNLNFVLNVEEFNLIKKWLEGKK